MAKRKAAAPDDKLFDPSFCSRRAIARVAKARATNAASSEEERQSGYGVPEDMSLSDHLRTVLMALNCGLDTLDWNVVAEAYCLLQDAELRVRLVNMANGAAK